MWLGKLTFVGVKAEALRDDERVMALWQQTLGPCWAIGTVYSVHTQVVLKPVSLFVVYDHSFEKCNSIPVANINFYATFYRLISKKAKIQSDMEMRSLNLILQTLLNDPCFTWK